MSKCPRVIEAVFNWETPRFVVPFPMIITVLYFRLFWIAFNKPTKADIVYFLLVEYVVCFLCLYVSRFIFLA